MHIDYKNKIKPYSEGYLISKQITKAWIFLVKFGVVSCVWIFSPGVRGIVVSSIDTCKMLFYNLDQSTE